MTLTVEDLLLPKGRLSGPALWPTHPPEKVQETVQAYLNEGYAKAEAITDESQQNEAARQWAYHRSYQEAFERLLLLPSTVSTDEGSASSPLTQIEHVGTLAQEALGEFNQILLAETTVPADVIRPSRASASVPVGFRF